MWIDKNGPKGARIEIRIPLPKYLFHHDIYGKGIPRQPGFI